MKSKKILSMIIVCTIISSMAIGCSKSDGSVSSAAGDSSSTLSTKPKVIKFMSQQDESTGAGKILTELTKEYSKTHPNVTLELEAVTQSGDIDQKTSVLAASDDLPDVFTAPTNSLLLKLVSANQVLDLTKALTDLGVKDALLPTTYTGMNNILGTTNLVAIPTENNIEGIWYNKKIFAANNLTVPTTVDELLAIAEKLKAKGIQPFSASGEQKWPLTRLVANLVMRELGVDSIVKVNKGTLPLTDASFLKATKIVQDMGTKGYFGQGVNTIGYDVANDTFLNGKAAMYYMGSWAVRDFNDAKKNTLGTDGIGFFNFPTVTGGKGSNTDYLMNYGLTFTLSKKKYDAQTADWLKYIVSNYGDYAMKTLGVITGFKMNNVSSDVPVYTKMVLDEMKKAKASGLWLEYALQPKASDAVTNNMQLLVLGKMTPEEYCKQGNDAIQTSLKK